jgi:hypothetical protein
VAARSSRPSCTYVLVTGASPTSRPRFTVARLYDCVSAAPA